VTSDLRRFLQDEFQRLGPQLTAMAREIREFWERPDVPALGVWGVPPVVAPPAPPEGGTAPERYLYQQLETHIRPAIEAHEQGFATVPTLLPHFAYHEGPFPQSHLVAAALGATVTDTGDPLGVGVEPLIGDLGELPRVKDADVSQSPLLGALCRSIEEMAEVTQGSLAFEPYLQHGPLDLAADVIGHQPFYELVALDPEGASRLLQVCSAKWLEFRQAQEQAAAGNWAGRRFEPGLYYGNSLMQNLFPQTIRDLVLPDATGLAEQYGGIVFGLSHEDVRLLNDVVALPHFRGCGVPVRCPADLVAEQLAGRGVLHMTYAGYRGAPDWQGCLAHVERLAGKVRLLANICPMHCRCFFEETNQQLRDATLRRCDDLRSAWRGM